jgi:hypothetical protein
VTPRWQAFRPAIWLAMFGVALSLLVSPPYIGAVMIGAAIGVAIRIRQLGRGSREPRGPSGSRGARRR